MYHNFLINRHSQTIAVRLETLSEMNACRPQIVAVASTSDNNHQELFVFYNSFSMVDSRIETLPMCTTASVCCCIVLSHREVECLLSGMNGSVNLDPSLISVSFPKE